MNWLNTILIFVVAFVAVFLESVFDGVRNLFGAQVDLLPALMVYAALSASLTTMTTLAVVAGLWFDTLSANPLGITILPLFAVGYAIYARRELILRDQLYAQALLGLLGSALVPALTVLLLSVKRRAPVLDWGFIWQWLVMSIGGAILTPLCFRLFDGLHHALNYRPVIETSFRPDRDIKRGRN